MMLMRVPGLSWSLGWAAAFVATSGGDVRALVSEDGTRLFCLYDTATSKNNAHADICQNLLLEPGTKNRKRLMMEFAWQLRFAFGLLLTLPPAQSTIHNCQNWS